MLPMITLANSLPPPFGFASEASQSRRIRVLLLSREAVEKQSERSGRVGITEREHLSGAEKLRGSGVCFLRTQQCVDIFVCGAIYVLDGCCPDPRRDGSARLSNDLFWRV